MPPYFLFVVPPAGLEPAALCLASSIRLSLTALKTGVAGWTISWTSQSRPV